MVSCFSCFGGEKAVQGVAVDHKANGGRRRYGFPLFPLEKKKGLLVAMKLW